MGNPEQKHASGVTDAEAFVTELVLGGLAGVGTALRLVPPAGKTTRTGIEQNGMDLSNRTVETVEGTIADARFGTRRITASADNQAEGAHQPRQWILEEQWDRQSFSDDWAARL